MVSFCCLCKGQKGDGEICIEDHPQFSKRCNCEAKTPNLYIHELYTELKLSGCRDEADEYLKSFHAYLKRKKTSSMDNVIDSKVLKYKWRVANGKCTACGKDKKKGHRMCKKCKEKFKPKFFVVGGIYGNVRALKECIINSGYRNSIDCLILLGDVTDVGGSSFEVVEFLTHIRRLVFVMGDHDKFFIEWMKTGKKPKEWIEMGGKETIESYKRNGITSHKEIPVSHYKLFSLAKNYHFHSVKLFIHANLDDTKPLHIQKIQRIISGDDIVQTAKKRRINGFSKIFIAHTPTQSQGSDVPTKINNLWMMDTGSAENGKLSIMNIETEEWWQSNNGR